MKIIFRISFLIFCFVSINAYSNPYPISPRPLRKLVLESDAIIIGNVIKIYKKTPEKKKKNIKHPTDTYARIIVTEVLQGKVHSDTLDIPFEPNMVCPAPPQYYEKTTVIAFLETNNKQYRTHALSYGVKTLDSAGISIYKNRVHEIQNILKIADPTQQRQETIEWLVKCSENPVTRWEGVFELSPESDFMSAYSQSADDNLGSYLSSQQKGRLKSALLSSTDFDYYDFALSDLIYKENQKEIDIILLDKLKKLSPEHYWYASDFMRRLKHLNNCSAIEDLLEKQELVELNYNNESEQKKIIDEFISIVER